MQKLHLPFVHWGGRYYGGGNYNWPYRDVTTSNEEFQNLYCLYLNFIDNEFFGYPEGAD